MKKKESAFLDIGWQLVRPLREISSCRSRPVMRPRRATRAMSSRQLR
jgi:hypothetical protein